MTRAAGELNLALDYDFTLFDTARFSTDLWQEVARLTDIPLAQAAADGEGFHADPVLGGYDYEKHMAAYGLESAAMWAVLDDVVRSNDYLYEDSAEFVQVLRAEGYRPYILSYGVMPYQRAKIVPYIGKLAGASDERRNTGPDLGYTIILRRKGEYIAEAYPGARGALVDDVANQILPEGFVEIHIDRSLELTSPQEKAGGFVVANLAQAQHVIRSL